MAKKKSKEFLLAEIAYAAGRKDDRVFKGNEKEIVRIGAEVALKKWKEQTGGKKPLPSLVELARKKWEAEGSRPEGTWFSSLQYKFTPDGDLDMVETFDANIGSDEFNPNKS
jgi:hypothetical protein